MPSKTFKFLRKIGLNYSETEYGEVSAMQVVAKVLKKYRNAFLLKFCMYSVIFSPLNHRMVRPMLWRWMGCKVGKNTFIGTAVMMDAGNAELIELEDNVHITSHCILLCHQRDMSDYRVGDDYARLPYIRRKITLKQGCLIGTNSLVMPGVTVGEGAIVGAGSLVMNDVPSWSVAVGRPAKVVKKIEHRMDAEALDSSQ